MKEVAFLGAGELVVSLLTVGGYLLSDLIFDTGFSWRVFTGVLLGSLVIILNFLFLSISVDRAVSEFIELRGTKEMSEEETEKFTTEHTARIQALIARSFIIRTLSMLAALIVAFVLDWFAPIATLVPMVAFRPLLTVRERIRQRTEPAPDPAKFIAYDADGNRIDESAPAEAEAAVDGEVSTAPAEQIPAECDPEENENASNEKESDN